MSVIKKIQVKSVNYDVQDAAAPRMTTIASVENGATASKAFSEGELLYRNDILYKVKTDISSGDAFVVDTNIEATVLSNELGGGMPENPLAAAHGGTGNANGLIQVGEASNGTIGSYATAEGANNYAEGDYSHAEGTDATAYGFRSHAEGCETCAYGDQSHAEGHSTLAYGDNSHAEGVNTTAYEGDSHAEGQSTYAYGDSSHAEGISSIAYGDNSHAEGINTTAYGDNSHAEGSETCAIGQGSHAEGDATTAYGSYSHTEGYQTYTVGDYSHAEGINTTAYGDYSHAEGYNTYAAGEYSHAEGEGTYTTNYSQFVIGYQNDNKSNNIFEIGNGTPVDEGGTRSNSLEVDRNGNLTVLGDISTLGSFIGDNNTIAPAENGDTSEDDYSIGDYIYRNHTLYKVIANINYDDAFVVNTNIQATTVGKELTSASSGANLPEIFKLTATLAAAATSVTFTDSRLGANTCVMAPMTSTGIMPLSVSYNDANHTYTVTFEAQQSAVTVAIICFNFAS